MWTKAVAYLFFLIIGTNISYYYSTTAGIATAGYLILVVLFYLIAVTREHTWLRVLTLDNMAWVAMLLLPIVVMALSSREFAWVDWKSTFSYLLVFVAGLLMANTASLRRTVGLAALSVVIVGTGMNLYEMFIENNVWSTSPGRSAGFHLNPNMSAGALVGYAGLFLATRDRTLRWSDYILAGLTFLGVATTFSRTGVLLAVLVFVLILVIKSNSRLVPLLSVIATLGLLVAFFLFYVVPQLELSEGAEQRLVSLISMSATQDFAAERGPLAAYALELFYDSPLTGLGVRTSLELPEGPHNMYVGLALDYGVFGVVVYLALLVRVIGMGIVAFRQRASGSALILPLALWFFVFSMGLPLTILYMTRQFCC